MIMRATMLFRQLRHFLGPRCADDRRDADLLERFLANQDDAAFEALLWRHGPMVFGICQRMIRHVQDAEDAFQATFLVLLRKAGTVRKSQSLASWLYKVAYRICVESRRKARSRREQALEHPPVSEAPDRTWQELRPLLDESLLALPEKYRRPLQLCYLDGKTCREAAEQLCCPLSTVLTRMAKGRRLLQTSLRRKGLSLSIAAMAGVLGQHAAAGAAPPHLVQATMQAFSALQAGTSGVVSSHVLTLAQGVIESMFTLKLRIAAAVVMVLGLIAAGTGLYAQSMDSSPPELPVSELRDTDAAGPTKRAVAAKEQAWTERRTIETETNMVAGLDFQRDGKRLVGHCGGQIIGWDVATGEEQFAIDWNSNGEPARLLLSDDGKRVAAVTMRGPVQVFETSTGKELVKFAWPAWSAPNPRARDPRNMATTVSNDFSRAVAGNDYGHVAAWDPGTGKELWRITEIPGVEKLYSVFGLAISPDNKTLVTGHVEGRTTHATRLRFWELETGKLLATVEQTFQHAQDFRFSADGKTLIVMELGTGIHLLDAAVGADAKPGKVKSTINTEDAGGFSANTDASVIVHAAVSSRVRVYDGATEKALATLRWQSTTGSAAITRDGKTVASSRDGRIRIWDLTAENEKE